MNGQMNKRDNRLVTNQVRKLQVCSWVLLTNMASTTDVKGTTDVKKYDQSHWQVWERIQEQALQQWESFKAGNLCVNSVDSEKGERIDLTIDLGLCCLCVASGCCICCWDAGVGHSSSRTHCCKR